MKKKRKKLPVTVHVDERILKKAEKFAKEFGFTVEKYIECSIPLANHLNEWYCNSEGERGVL